MTDMKIASALAISGPVLCLLCGHNPAAILGFCERCMEETGWVMEGSAEAAQPSRTTDKLGDLVGVSGRSMAQYIRERIYQDAQARMTAGVADPSADAALGSPGRVSDKLGELVGVSGRSMALVFCADCAFIEARDRTAA